jgi:hypothetical protein
MSGRCDDDDTWKSICRYIDNISIVLRTVELSYNYCPLSVGIKKSFVRRRQQNGRSHQDETDCYGWIKTEVLNEATNKVNNLYATRRPCIANGLQDARSGCPHFYRPANASLEILTSLHGISGGRLNNG